MMTQQKLFKYKNMRFGYYNLENDDFNKNVVTIKRKSYLRFCSNIDTDTMFGCIAWCIKPKN